MVYKFEISQPETSDFRCEIAIDSEQSFLDFHNKIVEVLGYDASQIASFFEIDRNGDRQREISLMDMSDSFRDSSDDRDQDEENALLSMESARICDVINASCIELDYVYDFFDNKSLRVEYEGEYVPKKSDVFPLCLSCEGNIPEQSSFDENGKWKFSTGRGDDDYDDSFMKEFSNDDDSFDEDGNFGDEDGEDNYRDEEFGDSGSSYGGGGRESYDDDDEYGGGRGGRHSGGRYDSIDDYIDRL